MKPGEQEVEEKKEKPAHRRTFKDDLKLLLPNRDYAVTQLLILLNIGIYLCMVIAGVDPIDPDAGELFEWGGNITVFSIGFREYWRLLTSCFLHNGLVHLLFNMYALLYVGSLLERVIGHSRFMFAYILAGLFSSLVSCWWSFDNLIVSVGASGAIFGLYGLYIALLLSNKILDKKEQKEMLPSMLIFVGYNLLYGLKDNIDNAAHVGGLVFGLAVGFCFLPALLRKGTETISQYLLSIGVPLVLLLGMFLAFNTKDLDELVMSWDDSYEGQPEELVEAFRKIEDISVMLTELDAVDAVKIPLQDLEKLEEELQLCGQLLKKARLLIMDRDTYMDQYLMYVESFINLKEKEVGLRIQYNISGFKEGYALQIEEVIKELQELESDFMAGMSVPEEEIEYEQYNYDYIHDFE